MNPEFSEKLLRSIFYSQTADELCQHLVHSVLNREGTISASLCRLDAGGSLAIVGHYGKQPATGLTSGELWSSDSLLQALSNNQVLNSTYPAVYSEETGSASSGKDSMFGILSSPVWVQGLISGGLQIVFNRYPNQHLISHGGVQLISTAFEPYLSKSLATSRKSTGSLSWQSSKFPTDLPKELTKRQLLILSEMATSKTYYQIASRLSVSESLVKQEAGKIFRFVGGRTRSEVVYLAKNLKIIESDDAAEPQKRHR